jgi:four helix bundle protein
VTKNATPDENNAVDYTEEKMNHEKLDCYQQLISVATDLGRDMAGWPKGYGYLVDQLRRAISSAVLNLAEGNGKRGKVERRRFFNISVGSIAEVSACLDIAANFNLMSGDDLTKIKGILKKSYSQIRKLP